MQIGNFIDVFLALHISKHVELKNTSIKLPSCIKLALTLFNEEDARPNKPQGLSSHNPPRIREH